MGEPVFREYAEQLVRDRVTSLWSRTRRGGRTGPTDEALERPVLTPVEPSTETRTDWFARELGETWVEVEPGIYIQPAA